MMIESVSGIGSASLGAGVRSPTAAGAPTQGPSFDQALAQMVGSAVDTLQAGEAVAIQGIQGAAPPMSGLRLSRGCAHGDLIESRFRWAD